MNLSNQSKEVIAAIGHSMAGMFAMRLSPLQIMILMDLRWMESQLQKGKALTAKTLRDEVTKVYTDRNQPPPTKQAFWHACNSLRDSRLIYYAPPKKNSTHRNITLTADGESLMTYPPSVHPYR